jgi:hypothetical protein
MFNPYVDVIGHYYPLVQCHATGTAYADIIHDGGEAIPSQEVLEPLILNLKRLQVWEKIKSLRESRKAGGVQVAGNWFHSDEPSRVQQLGLVMMGSNLPPLQWKTLSGSFVTMTPTLALGIFQAVATHDTNTFAKAEQHRAAVNASSDPLNYDYTTGWPVIYGE